MKRKERDLHCEDRSHESRKRERKEAGGSTVFLSTRSNSNPAKRRDTKIDSNLRSSAGSSVAADTFTKEDSKSFKKRRKRRRFGRPRRKKKRIFVNSVEEEKLCKRTRPPRIGLTRRKGVREVFNKDVESEAQNSTQVEGAIETPEGSNFLGEKMAQVIENSGCSNLVLDKVTQADNRDADASLCGNQIACQNTRVFGSAGREQIWTKEQEVALQNAYFLVRPAPNFWREIAKKVPGKTAKECFNRFYSAYPTPPLPQPRARRHCDSSPIKSLEAFQSPTVSAVKPTHRPRSGKQVLIEAHRTVRHILRKQQTADEGYEADVFASLQSVDPDSCIAPKGPTVLPSYSPAFESRATLALGAMSTLDSSSSKVLGFETECKNKSCRTLSAGKAEQPSVVHHSYSKTPMCLQGQLLSPEVLKREINPKRLDRYLDLLHSRRLERRRTSSQKSKPEPSPAGKGKARGLEAARAGARDMLKAVLGGRFPGLKESSCITIPESIPEEEDERSLDLE